VHNDDNVVLRLISFDIDGTLESGDPPGAITLHMVREAKARGWFIGSCSDRTAGAQRLMWERHDIKPDFTVLKHQLDQVKLQFKAENYLHIGDTEVDQWYAQRAGFEFLHIDDAPFVDWLLALGPFKTREDGEL
jgi:hypothetical protein